MSDSPSIPHDPQSFDASTQQVAESVQKNDMSKHPVFDEGMVNTTRRRLASLSGPEMVALRSEWAAGALTIGQMCDVWRVGKEELLAEAARWGKRAVKAEYQARLSAGLVDNEQAFGAVVADGGDLLPRDASQAVDRAVARAVEVVRQHKDEIASARRIVVAMFAELDESENELTLPQRAAAADKLVNALQKAVMMERQAFQIADEAGDGKAGDHIPLEERLKRYVQHGGLPNPSH